MYKIKFIWGLALVLLLEGLAYGSTDYLSEDQKQVRLISRLLDIVRERVAGNHYELFRQTIVNSYESGQFENKILKPAVVNYVRAKRSNQEPLANELGLALEEYNEAVFSKSHLADLSDLNPSDEGYFIDVDCWGKCMKDIGGGAWAGAEAGAE